jgi:hypothetical protein
VSAARGNSKFVQTQVLAGCLAAVLLLKPVQDRIEAHIGYPAVEQDILYFSSPSAIKKMALGYESILADLYWMRTIQYYGRREEAERRAVRFKNLGLLLDITTTLDSEMLDVYRTGSYLLGEPEPVGAGQPREALKLLDKGMRFHPEEWRLPYDKGFAYFIYLRDYRKAGEVWLEASRMPGAPEWLEALAAKSLLQGGAMETAKSLWQRQYDESDREDVRLNARNRLNSIMVDEHIWTLSFLVEKYVEQTGRLPDSLDELVRARMIPFVPVDPSGVPYIYDMQNGEIRLSARSDVRRSDAPPEYRDSFRARLEQSYAAAPKPEPAKSRKQ